MNNCCVFCVFFLLPVFICSQKKDAVDQNVVPPGTTASVSFMIVNNTAEKKRYETEVKTSAPFISALLSRGETEVSGNDSTVYIVPVKIAAATPHGTYFLELYGTEKSTREKFSLRSVFTVSEKRQLVLSALSAPEFVKAGEVIASSFLLRNSGNIAEHLILESRNAVIDGTAAFTLQAGEERMVTVTKNTLPELEKDEYQNLNLSVYSAEDLKEQQSIYTSIRVIPVKPVEADAFHRLPVSASVAFTGMQNRGNYRDGFQGEIYGKGSLDKDQKNLLEFHAVTKNPVEFNSFTPYEEYFLNYRRKNIYLHLGDKNYSSSYITEYARYGRGAEIRVDAERFSFGGFYNHPRFFRDIKEEFNGYLRYRIARESEITAGYLYKIPGPENSGISLSTFRLDSNARLPYLTGKFRLHKNIEVSAETSYSKTRTTHGNAFMVQSVASFSRLSGNLMYMHTSPAYAGYFNNTATFNGNLQYQLSKKIGIMANYVQDARNFQRDTLFLAAPYRKYLQYGIQYRYSKNGSMMLYNGFQRYQDRLMPREFDYKEKFFRITADQQVGIFQLNLQGQFGKTDNYLLSYTGSSSFYTAGISFEKFRTSFYLYGSYAMTSRYQMPNQKQVYYGARITSRFSEKTGFSLFYQNNYMPEEYFADRNLFELLFRQQILPGHEMDLSGRCTLQRGELGNKDFIFSFRYTVRLDIPTQKTTDYTSLYGTISNLGVRKTDGIRLMLGTHVSVTDKDGNFMFKNMVPGNYTLEIDRSTTDLHDIPDVNIPASLHLVNKENVYNFGLTGAARIQGSVRLTENNRQDFIQLTAEKKDRKKDHMIVEASNGSQTYRKMAAIGESFDFTYLRPGPWTVKIYRNGLDKRYKIPVDQFGLDLQPSDIQKVIFSVIKQSGEVKYQQEPVRVTYHTNRNQNE